MFFKTPLFFPYLIIGGGIAGVTCAESLHHLDQNAMIGLITMSDTIKSITNLHRITKLIEDFNVIDTPVSEFISNIPQLSIIKGIVAVINVVNKHVLLDDDTVISYTKICICSGGRPRLIGDNSDFVIGIRDTNSVELFKQRLKACKKIAVVGNGGIATELVHEVSDCELLWLVKDKSISSHFFDGAAAHFLLNSADNRCDQDKGAEKVNAQRHHFSIDGKTYSTERRVVGEGHCILGGALGPDWAQNLKMQGSSKRKVEIKYGVEVKKLDTEPLVVASLWQIQKGEGSVCDHNVALTLTDDSVEFCDLVVSATGVTPQFPKIVGAKLNTSDKDGGILVSEDMDTNIDDVYAAGDCCTPNWPLAQHWFQMRLWSQARTMAIKAAKCMFMSLNEDPSPTWDFGFELFTHVTKFFGFSVILLGLYNGQKIDLQDNGRAELLIRTSPGLEYIKCVLLDGRVQGAILIGDTELAETLEDLIIDQIDVSSYGEHLLDPDIDIVDHFD